MVDKIKLRRDDGYGVHINAAIEMRDLLHSINQAGISANLWQLNPQTNTIYFDPNNTFSGTSYKGAWNALSNTPDLNTTGNGGDMYRVSESGEVDLGNGRIYYEIGDLLIYNGNSWDHYPTNAATIEQIETSSLSQYDITVDADYRGDTELGSSLQPFKTIDAAISAASDGSRILIKGYHPDAPFVLPSNKGLTFVGTDTAVVGYNSYDATNGDVFTGDAVDNTKVYRFENLAIQNAGGYGILLKNAKRTEIEDCVFIGNGWSGRDLNTILDSATSGLLGYDSNQADLQAFYAGPEASNGGAIRVENSTFIEVVSNVVQGNLRSIRLQDCGIGGAGFVTRNIATQNIESGIYLAAGSLGGCQNIVVTINSSTYNANNGILCIGGINNKVSQNDVSGNWNAGTCGWGVANFTLRDSGLYDNNRSQFNGIGNIGDAKASIQIEEASTYTGTSLAMNRDARFIAEILDTQVHYTGRLGDNVNKVGFYLGASMSALPDDDHNIIKVDDVGFIGQDYAVDFSDVDISNLRVSLGDNSYQNIGTKAVRAPLLGDYNELPFSNHVMAVPEVDIVVDTLKKTIALHEGVGGNVINVYGINELISVNRGSHIDLVQRASDKIQLRGLTLGHVYVNGVQAGSNVTTMNDTVNAALAMTLEQYKDFIKSDVFDYTDDGTSPPIVETNEPLVDGANYNSTYMSMGVPDGNGQSTLIADNAGPSKTDVWSTVPLNQLGEYSVFQTDSNGGGKTFYVGFSRDAQLATLGDGSGGTANGIQWALGIHSSYNGPWSFTGDQPNASYNGAYLGGSQEFRDKSGILTGKVTWKVGINETDGKFYVWFWDLQDEVWRYAAKTNYTLVADDYHPVVRFMTNGGGFYNGFDNFRFEEPENTATFFYIESPDGVYHYPLFQTAEEANAVDAQLGGAGSSHVHTYIDDTSGTTWYMPNTGGTMNSSSAPVDGDFVANGVTLPGVTWNVQVTDDDSNYAATFTDLTFTVAEGSAINIQYKPQGDTANYTLTNVPSYLTDTGYALLGTAEAITDGVDVTHVINVTKHNGYAPGTGTITLNITDDPSNNATDHDTSWNKAVDFSGGSQYSYQTNSSTDYTPVSLDGISATASGHATAGYTSGHVYSRPWATAIVFKADGHNSNQHIWNQGGGANDDNIYLRLTASRKLYFGWGRDGSGVNECLVADISGSISSWHGVYIGHTGERLSGSNATAAGLADCFDIRYTNASSNWDAGSNLSTVNNWESTGYRMDRNMGGQFTVGGRGSNRSFHGKVASMVVTTLRINQPMPDATEIKEMIADPSDWVADYKVGQSYRVAYGQSEATFQILNYTSWSSRSTQVWLMGDGVNDSYSNMIRNQTFANDQNYTMLRLQNMQSNDIVNVSINGLS